MTRRHTESDIAAWRRDGGVLVESFFTAEEVAAVAADFEAVFGRSSGDDEALKTNPDDAPQFHPKQFDSFEAVPFDCSPALNLIGVHPALVAFAQDALQTQDLHLYQCQAWAKYTGAADYAQPFHCDFANHTLTVPSEDARDNSVTILCYFSEVTERHGPMHYVTRPDSEALGATHSFFSDASGVQARLRERERSSAGPAGSIFPYGIDVYHRGTNLTQPGGVRYAVMACFKRADNPAIGYHAWPFHHTKPWHRIFDHATPEQLACFGVQRPGDPFWTETTLTAAQARYPNWDLTPYRDALAG